MKFLALARFLVAGSLLLGGVASAATTYDLGRELAEAKAWRDLTWDVFGSRHPGSRYSITDASTRTLAAADYTFFGYPLCEAELAFGDDGFLDRLSVSLFNKGDAGSTATEDEAFSAVTSLPFFLNAKPSAIVGDGRGKTITSYDWTDGSLVAEANVGISNATGMPRRVEYVTVKMARNRPAPTPRASSVPAENLVRQRTRIYIDGIPMVQQGQKGYCAPATLARILGYYGIDTDMHELALLLETDVGGGTRINAAFPSLTRVAKEAGLVREDYWRLGEMKPDLATFAKNICDNINQGYPLIWGVSRTFPWDSAQGQGAHMRLIVGYDAVNGEVLYSDSWGASSALKSAALEESYEVTDFIICLHPAKK